MTKVDDLSDYFMRRRMTRKEYLDWRLDQVVKESVEEVVERAKTIIANRRSP